MFPNRCSAYLKMLMPRQSSLTALMAAKIAISFLNKSCGKVSNLIMEYFMIWGLLPMTYIRAQIFRQASKNGTFVIS